MLVRHGLLALLGNQALLLLLRQAQLAIALHRFALVVVATLDLTHVEGTLLLDAMVLAALLHDLLLMQGALLRRLLIGSRRHRIALVATTRGHVLLAVTQGLGLCGALFGDLLLLTTLLVPLALANFLGVLDLLLAACLRLLGDLLALRSLLRRDALQGGLALFGTALFGAALGGSLLLRTLRGFATHGGLLACLFGLRRCLMLLAGLGLCLRLFGLLFAAVLLVVTTLLLRASLCNGADGQDGADHDGQDVSTCGIQVHGDPRSGHGRRLLPRDALHGRAT
ncbi:MAG TPA: hypothetical protein VKM00_03525 [Luteimonas sp.]|nr:hypothetical protein [Luteimonas sp.]